MDDPPPRSSFLSPPPSHRRCSFLAARSSPLARPVYRSPLRRRRRYRHVRVYAVRRYVAAARRAPRVCRYIPIPRGVSCVCVPRAVTSPPPGVPPVCAVTFSSPMVSRVCVCRAWLRRRRSLRRPRVSVLHSHHRGYASMPPGSRRPQALVDVGWRSASCGR